MKYALIGVVALAVSGAGLVAYRLRSAPPEPQGSDPLQMELATTAESDERAARLLPTKGSEDVSHLLVRPKLPAADPLPTEPLEAIEWVIDITATRPGTVFKRDELTRVFNPEWFFDRYLASHVNVHGRGAADQKWSFAHAVNAPADYDQLAIGVEFKSNADHPVTAAELDTLARAIEVAAKELGAVTVKPRVPAKVAASRFAAMASLLKEVEDSSADVVLAAPQGATYDGKAIWDVMLCLGLHWGDLDLFHWENAEGAAGDEHLFSVMTNSDPGYFLPEHIAADDLHTEDLVFSFDVPRSAEPAAVLEGMLAAATYAQKRLGGELRDEAGAKLDPAALRKRVADLSARLTKAGFPPGGDAAMMLF